MTTGLVVVKMCDSVAFIISPTPAKIGGHEYCEIGDVIILACHVISQDHKIKGLSNIKSRSPLKLTTSLPSLVVLDTAAVEM